MKVMLVANEGLATTMLGALKNYQAAEDVKAVDFNHPTHKAAAEEVKNYLKNLDINEKIVVITDKFGSTAFIETVLELERTGRIFNALILRGMSLPMVIQVASLRENVNGFETCQRLYKNANAFTYEVKDAFVTTLLRDVG